MDGSPCRWLAHKRKRSLRPDGRDPAEEKKQSRRRLVVDRIDDLIEAFIHEHISQTVSRNRISNLLRRDVIPHWGAKSIHEIKKRDVSDLIGLISQRNAHAGHRLLKTLKTFFRWCVGRAVIDFSPVEGLSSGYRESSRDRVLKDRELAVIIIAARQMPPPYGGVVELLALTGQRRQEVSKLKWDELDEKSRTWSIPGSRTKNKKAHIVHLSEPAWQVIAQRPVGTYVFGTSGAKHFQAYSTSKRALDTLSGITGCRPHDRRRTIVSAWPGSACRRMSPIKFSTTKPARFRCSGRLPTARIFDRAQRTARSVGRPRRAHRPSPYTTSITA
jgi:integrase